MTAENSPRPHRENEAPRPASMRPRPMTAENMLPSTTSTTCSLWRFNEAAADDRGKHEGGLMAGVLLPPLQ